METYLQQKQRHQEEFSQLNGIFYAFSNEQFERGMKSIGLTVGDADKIYSLNGTGGYILKERRQDYLDLITRHNKEVDALKSDKDSLFSALVYELKNHEYCYTRDYTSALEFLDLDYETIDKDLLKKACNKAIEDCED